ncbi:MAG TPA: lipoyl(octanoyl) transferase LipB [Paenalcaligenes sp.]|nr:lipoyl(octanoyl) transferase LipB [Paenalcaligenes sp.]
MSSDEAGQASEPLQVHWLSGRQSFAPLWEAMRDYTAQRTADSPDQLWLLEHEPVYTLGLAGRIEHVLNPRAIPLVHTDRGGQVTYHGPGQLVAYCLLDLRRYGLYVKSYVALLERVILDTLAALGADYACLQPGAPGVYVPLGQSESGAGTAHAGQTAGQLAKIAALGVKINKGCSYHGIAINVDMDLSPFEGINPCGYAGLRTTDLAHCGIHTTVSRVGQLFTSHLQHTLSHRLSVTTLD